MKRKTRRISVMLITAVLVVAAAVCGIIHSNNIKAKAANELYRYDVFSYRIEGDFNPKVIITGCDGSVSGEITIPSIIGGKVVYQIDASAFFACKNLTSVVIPDSVTTIGNYAFYNCTNLASVVIPDSVTKIGCGILDNTSIYNNDNCWNDDALYIGNHLISSKKSVSGNFTVKNGIKTIASEAFVNCTELTGITIPDSVVCIGDRAFSNCENLQILNIGNNHSLRYIGIGAFSSCSNLEGNLVLREAKISEHAFYRCEKIESVTSTTINTIGKSAFSGCTSLKKADIRSRVENYVFYGCINLEELSIASDAFGGSNESISKAFEGCSNIKKLKFYPSGTGSLYDYSYNSTYQSFYVRSLKYTPMFVSGESIEEIIIDDGISGIGDYNFYYCKALKKVTISDSVIQIGSNAFANCENLEKVEIGENSSLKIIKSNAFANCSNLTSITFPTKIDEIKSNAMPYVNTIYYSGSESEWSRKLSAIQIGENNSWIYDSFVIYECFSAEPYGGKGSCGQNLTWCLYPNKELVITGYGNMSSIYIFDIINDKYYRTSPWYQYSKFINSVSLPDNLTSICEYAFKNCVNLTSINIPNKVTDIGTEAFYNSGLTNVKIGDGVRTIGEKAFANCTKLATITIPDEVIGIEQKAFEGCHSLTTVNYNATNCNYVRYTTGFENCPNLKTINIGKNVKSLPGYIFCGCTGVTSVTIPDGVTNIGSYAFNRTGLKSVIIPDSVTTIGSSVFKDCSNLETVIIGNGVTDLGGNTFEGCNTLASVTLPHELELIGGESFKDCIKLSCVNIPESVRYIYQNAFYNCVSLASITIPENIIYINDSAFYNCTGLTTVNYNATKCTAMGSSEKVVFKNCSNLKTINIGKNVKSIPDYAFAWYLPVENIAIPNSVTSIGSYAFAFCENIKKVIIPDSVTKIGAYAFGYCYGMEHIHIPANVTAIGENVLKSTDAYICSDSLDSYAKTYTAENGIPFMLCDGHEAPHFHSYTASSTTPASCTVPGATLNTCTCGNNYQEGIPALGHKASEWQTVIQATEESEGKKIKTCTTCGETVEEKILPVILIKTATENKFGIAMEYNANSFNGEVAILASKTENQTITSLVENAAGSGEMQVHSIAVTVNGVVTQPEEAVTLKIPIPEDFDAEKTSVYSVNPETGKVEEISAEYENGCLVFEATEMNYYAVVEKSGNDNSGNEGGNNGNSGNNSGENGESGKIEVPIKSPSTTTINYGDAIILHIDASKIPEGGYVVWTASNGNFDMDVSADGTTCKISPSSSGDTTFTATVYDADGNAVSADEQTMTSKAGFFQKIIAFFKKLFGLTKTISSVFKF